MSRRVALTVQTRMSTDRASRLVDNLKESIERVGDGEGSHIIAARHGDTISLWMDGVTTREMLHVCDTILDAIEKHHAEVGDDAADCPVLPRAAAARAALGVRPTTDAEVAGHA